jgi:hypothetical protein
VSGYRSVGVSECRGAYRRYALALNRLSTCCIRNVAKKQDAEPLYVYSAAEPQPPQTRLRLVHAFADTSIPRHNNTLPDEKCCEGAAARTEPRPTKRAIADSATPELLQLLNYSIRT